MKLISLFFSMLLLCTSIVNAAIAADTATKANVAVESASWAASASGAAASPTVISPAAPALVTAPAAVPSPASANLVHVTLALLLVVGLLVGLSVVVKKFGINRIHGGGFPVKVIGAISVGNNQRLLMVEAGDEWLLLGVTAQQINLITKMPPQEGSAAVAPSQQFSSWMQRALEKYHAKKS